MREWSERRQNWNRTSVVVVLGAGAGADAVLHAVERREAQPSDDRWPRLDRSIIQGFALDDVDGLPRVLLLQPPESIPAL